MTSHLASRIRTLVILTDLAALLILDFDAQGIVVMVLAIVGLVSANLMAAAARGEFVVQIELKQ